MFKVTTKAFSFSIYILSWNFTAFTSCFCCVSSVGHLVKGNVYTTLIITIVFQPLIIHEVCGYLLCSRLQAVAEPATARVTSVLVFSSSHLHQWPLLWRWAPFWSHWYYFLPRDLIQPTSIQQKYLYKGKDQGWCSFPPKRNPSPFVNCSLLPTGTTPYINWYCHLFRPQKMLFQPAVE